ncbi:hypothetical protein GC175_18715 [bacterium]|nr:hypothetical protein [bacterium]
MPRANYGQRADVGSKQNGRAVTAARASSAQVRLTIQRAQEDPTSLQVADIDTLQRSIGNQATIGLIHPIIQSQRVSASATPTIQRKEQSFSEDKVLQPLIRKVTYYNDQSTNGNIGSDTQSLYQNVSKRYEKLVELLNLYNTIPQNDTNFDQQLDLLQGINFWIDKLYQALKSLWHIDRVVHDGEGGIGDEFSANARRGKIAKDMNGTLLNALLGNGGRLQKLYGKVSDEIDRVTQQQANQPPQEWAYAQPENFVYSPFRKSKNQKRQEFSNRLANPYAIAGQQRGFLPHSPSKDTESGLRQTQNTSFGSNGSFGSRQQWQAGTAETFGLQNPYFGSNGTFGSRHQWQGREADTSQPQNTSFGSNGTFGSRHQWQGGTATGDRSSTSLGKHRVWQESTPDTSQPQNTSFGSNGTFGSRHQWQGGQADTSQPQNESFGSNGSFGSRHQWQGGQADTSQPQNESFGSNGSFGSRRQWKQAFPRVLEED